MQVKTSYEIVGTVTVTMPSESISTSTSPTPSHRELLGALENKVIIPYTVTPFAHPNIKMDCLCAPEVGIESNIDLILN